MILLYVDTAQIVQNKINEYLDANPDYDTLRSYSLAADNVIPVYERVAHELKVFRDKAIAELEAEFEEKMSYVRASTNNEKLQLEKNQKQANIYSDCQFLLEEAKQLTNYYLIVVLRKRMPNSLSLQEKTVLQAIVVAMSDYWETQARLKSAKENLLQLESELKTEMLALKTSQEKLQDLQCNISTRYGIRVQLESEINTITQAIATRKAINRNLLIVGTAALLITVALFTLPELIISGIVASILAWTVPLVITGPIALILLISSCFLGVKNNRQEKELTQRKSMFTQNNSEISNFESECSLLQYNLIPTMQLRKHNCNVLLEQNHDIRTRLINEAKESLKRAQQMTMSSPEKKQSKFMAPKRIGAARALMFASDACKSPISEEMATPLKVT